MTPLALKSLLATLALLVPGALGAGYAVTEAMAEEKAAANHAQATFGGEVLESWAADVPETVTRAALDLRAFDGTVYVAGWDRAAYEVTVLAAVAEGEGQRLSDATVTTAFEDDSTEDALALTLTLARSGTYDFRVNDASSERYALVAFVPAMLVADVFACAGSAEGAEIENALIPLGESRGESCIASAGPIGGSINVMGGASEASSLKAPFGIADLKVGEAALEAEYADLFVSNVQGDSVSLVTAYGDARVADSLLSSLSIMTAYGDVDVVRSELTKLGAITEYGDVVVEATFLDESELDVVSGYGDVRVLVPGASEFGYVIDAATEYGEIRIRLPDVEAEEEKPEDVGRATSGILDRLVQVSEPPKESRGERVHVETENVGERANVLTMSLATRYGDVTVADLLLKEPEPEA